MTSNLGCEAEPDGFAVEDTDADDVVDGLPFTAETGVGAAVTLPKLLGACVFIGGTEAGEEEIGAESSSIDPNVTEVPVKHKRRKYKSQNAR